MARFQFFPPDRRLTDRRLTDRQNRLLNPASRMRARGKVTEGVSGHGPSFRSLEAVFANNCTALESSKVGYACALTIIRKNC